MPERTFGWVQDPGRIGNLRKVAAIFVPDSPFNCELQTRRIPCLVAARDGREDFLTLLSANPINIRYADLVGNATKPRSESRCNGIVQAAIPGQRRPFISDWAADNFVRWAHALGFIEYNRASDSFMASRRGKAFVNCAPNSEEEYQILSEAMLSYPPVSRVLTLLADAAQRDESMTKFEMGRMLGFVGEMGFTTISQDFFVKEYAISNDEARRRMRQNWEGDSDKYARMICSWLCQLKHPWVRRDKKKLETVINGKDFVHSMTSYALTRDGFEARKSISGASTARKVTKFVPFEMLCTKSSGRQFLRLRRAHVIQTLKSKARSLPEIIAHLKKAGIAADLSEIKLDIRGLEGIGLTIEQVGEKYRCRDKVAGLEIPQFTAEETRPFDVSHLVARCAAELKKIPADYLVLIDYAFGGREKSKFFEIKIAELLCQECGFDGRHLGGANRPDVIFYDGANYGVIVDAKAHSGGFNISISEADKMIRYLRDARDKPPHNKTKWWEHFPPALKEVLFLFVSGKFGGAFREQLRRISAASKDAGGAAISAYALLRRADSIALGEVTASDFKRELSCLDEINAD